MKVENENKKMLEFTFDERHEIWCALITAKVRVETDLARGRDSYFSRGHNTKTLAEITKAKELWEKTDKEAEYSDVLKLKQEMGL